MSHEAKASIDRLFNEPFEPAWMKRQRQDEQGELERWKKLVKERADLGWKLETEKSHQRIMANCRGFGGWCEVNNVAVGRAV